MDVLLLPPGKRLAEVGDLLGHQAFHAQLQLHKSRTLHKLQQGGVPYRIDAKHGAEPQPAVQLRPYYSPAQLRHIALALHKLVVVEGYPLYSMLHRLAEQGNNLCNAYPSPRRCGYAAVPAPAPVAAPLHVHAQGAPPLGLDDVPGVAFEARFQLLTCGMSVQVAGELPPAHAGDALPVPAVRSFHHPRLASGARVEHAPGGLHINPCDGNLYLNLPPAVGYPALKMLPQYPCRLLLLYCALEVVAGEKLHRLCIEAGEAFGQGLRLSAR